MTTTKRETQHTPGPWNYYRDQYDVTDQHGRRGSTATVMGNNHVVAHMAAVPGVHHVTAEEREANARLIAAAPDLLAALEALDDSDIDQAIEAWPYPAKVDMRVKFQAACAAIRKAKGE